MSDFLPPPHSKSPSSSALRGRIFEEMGLTVTRSWGDCLSLLPPTAVNWAVPLPVGLLACWDEGRRQGCSAVPTGPHLCPVRPHHSWGPQTADTNDASSSSPSVPRAGEELSFLAPHVGLCHFLMWAGKTRTGGRPCAFPVRPPVPCDPGSGLQYYGGVWGSGRKPDESESRTHRP